MTLDTKTKRTVTFRRVQANTADALAARGWRCMGGYDAADYSCRIMMRRTERDDAPGGEDGYGGE